MAKIFYILIFCCCFSATVFSQAVLFINAGSRATWGNNQELTINKNGSCSYYLRAVNGPAKDSARFNMLPAQVQDLLIKADQLGFFSLNNLYKGKAVDGAGIYISISSGNKKNNVQLVNTKQPVIDELIIFLNTMLAPQNIIINYGQFVNR